MPSHAEASHGRSEGVIQPLRSAMNYSVTRQSKEESRMKYSRCFGVGLLLLLGVARVFAADISGTWKASFDTQIGQQNYS